MNASLEWLPIEPPIKGIGECAMCRVDQDIWCVAMWWVGKGTVHSVLICDECRVMRWRN